MIYISKLWKFIQGYVIITIKGYNIEKLINKAIQNNINIKNIKKSGNTAQATISPKEFRDLKKLCRKYKCKSKIKSKNGFYRLLLYLRLNLFYGIGVLLAIIFIYFLTQRVWIIDITGTSQINKLSILTCCDENGLYFGCNKNTLDCKKIAENLKLTYKNISWINVSLKGSVIHIKLSEDKPETEIAVSGEPVNIVAAIDCCIASIVTDKGTPQVKKNDVVKAGDILISAQLAPSGLEENPVTNVVSAKGFVRGIVTRTYSFTVPYTSNKKQYTGRTRTQYTVKAFNKEIALNKVKPFEKSDNTVDITQLNLGESCPLPFFIVKKISSEYILSPVKINTDQAKKQADKQIVEHIVQSYSTDADILSVNTSYNESKNTLQVSAEITSEENAAKEIPYENLGGNALNGTTENSNIS